MSRNTENQIKSEMWCNLYSVQDRVAGFNNVMTVRTDAIAIRSFVQAVLAPNSMFRDNPEDYCLTKVGKINVLTGEVIPEYEELAEAWDIIKKHGTNSKDSNENKEIN